MGLPFRNVLFIVLAGHNLGKEPASYGELAYTCTVKKLSFSTLTLEKAETYRLQFLSSAL